MTEKKKRTDAERETEGGREGEEVNEIEGRVQMREGKGRHSRCLDSEA